MKSTYGLPLSCAYCAGGIKHVATGTTNGWETRAVCSCADCGSEFVLHVRLVPAVDSRRSYDQRAAAATARKHLARVRQETAA